MTTSFDGEKSGLDFSKKIKSNLIKLGDFSRPTDAQKTTKRAKVSKKSSTNYNVIKSDST